MKKERREFIRVAGNAGIAMAASHMFPYGVQTAFAKNSNFSSDITDNRVAASTASLYRPYRSRPSATATASAWIQIDLESSYPIHSVCLHPSHEVLSPGEGFPVRFFVEYSDEASPNRWHPIADRSREDYPNPSDQVVQFHTNSALGRYVRISVIRLKENKLLWGLDAFRKNLPPGYVLSLSRIEVISSGQNVAVNRKVTVDQTIGEDESAQQLTRSGRPQGEFVVTDYPENVTSPENWHPVSDIASPLRRSVRLEKGLFHTAFDNNITYLLDSFSPDDLLWDFRTRAGKQVPNTSHTLSSFWDMDLGGANAGRFLMGAGNSLQWSEHTELRRRVNSVVTGIAECQQPNGYIMGYPEDTIFVSERGAYARAWLTLGLIAAGYAGNGDSFNLLRAYYDWFNQSKYLSQCLRRCTQGGQGMIANTQVFFTPVGKNQDVQTVQRYFQESYWLKDLSKREVTAIWQYPYDRPHAYLVTNILAYMDLYRATGDSRYLEAVDGGWDLYHINWENVGGSISIIESECCPPRSNKLYAEMGETCGSAFWILLNHRLHCLRPGNEKYVAEIEKSLYNVILANQDGAIGYRYHTILQGPKEKATRINTCCEGQACRIIGSLPEYIFSRASDGLYINLYTSATSEWNYGGGIVRVAMRTQFPYEEAVEVEIVDSTDEPFTIYIRIPSWSSAETHVKVNGVDAASGSPGTYVALKRRWTKGDEVTFGLSMALKLTPYVGQDQPEGRARFALEYGPLLMAGSGIEDSRILLVYSTEPRDLVSLLVPVSGKPCHFTLPQGGDSVITFIPYLEITDQSICCFPIIESRPSLFPSSNS